MNLKIVPIEKDIINEVIDVFKVTNHDYSSYRVVFPNKRPAHFLRKYLFEKIGRSYIPPLIFSMDELIDYIYEEKLRLTYKKAGYLECVSIIYKIVKEGKIKGIYLKEPSLDLFFPLGVRLFRLFEELIIEQVSTENLINITNIVYDFIENTDIHLNLGITINLNEFINIYKEEILHHGLSTRAMRYEIVSREVKCLEDMENYIFAGFFGLTVSERIIFKQIFKNYKNILIVQEGPFIYETLKGFDENIEDRKPTIKIPENTNIYQSPDTHGEIFTINRIVKEKDLNLDERTCFVIPEPDILFPLGNFLLSNLKDIEYNVSVGYPLIRTPIFGFLSNLMQLLITKDNDAFYMPDYINLLLHPYTKNIQWGGSSEKTRILVHWLEKRLITPFLSLNEIENSIDREKAEHLRYINDNLIRPYLNISDIRDFANKIIATIKFIEKETTAKKHPLFIPLYDKFLELLESLKDIGLLNLKFQHIGSYFNFLKHLVKLESVPFPGTPLKGLQILGFLETRCLSFERLFVLDCNEEILPRVEEDDNILPTGVRKSIGLTTYKEREKIWEYYLFTLLAKAKEVHLFYKENNKNLRSRFIEKILWEKQKIDKNLEDKGLISKINYKIQLREKKKDPIQKTEEVVEFLKGFEFSPSAIDLYFKCGHAYYYQYVLNLKQNEGLSEDIETNIIGGIVHTVLKNFFEPYKGKKIRIMDDFESALDNEIKKIIEQNFGKPLRGKYYLLYYQIKKHLIDYIGFEKYRSDKTDILIKDLEAEKKCQWNGFILRGKIDRIDKIGDNYLIMDYKTGSSGRSKIKFDKLSITDKTTWEKAIPSFQLPIYIILFSESERLNLSSINASYIDLSQQNFKGDINKIINYIFEETVQACHNNFNIIKEIILEVLKEITSPEKPFIATNDINKCKYCNFQYICGTKIKKQ